MGNIERGYNHPRAALEHAIRDPAIAQHEGWQQDARAAVDVIERLRQQHQGAVAFSGEELHCLICAMAGNFPERFQPIRMDLLGKLAKAQRAAGGQ